MFKEYTGYSEVMVMVWRSKAINFDNRIDSGIFAISVL